ncbi:MAG: alpha/beta hydrolase [Rikenellaceae bacterium]
MKKIFMSLLLMVALSTATAAEPLHIPIWDNSTAPHSNGLSGEDKKLENGNYQNITHTDLYIYEADREKNTGQAILICPGGGYGAVAVGKAGIEFAEWLSAEGITAAVLKYRLPNGVKEVPFEDVEAAMKVMRQRSRQLGYDPNKVGLSGSSAGGHLVSWFASMADESVKPNFTVLFFPVITGDKGVAHEGSFNNLLGKDRSTTQTLYHSVERLVDKNTPPSLIFHSSDDKLVPVENGVRYYEKLIEFKIPAAMYLFPTGGHGWIMRDKVPVELWGPLMLDWMKYINK